MIVGAWIDTLRQQAGGTNNAELETSDAGMLLTNTELLFANAHGVQRARLVDIAKVGREDGALLISSSNGPLIRGPMTASKDELAAFFASVRQVAARARQTGVSEPVAVAPAPQSLEVSTPSLGSSVADVSATTMMPAPIMMEAVPPAPAVAPMISPPPAPMSQAQVDANALERERFRAGFGEAVAVQPQSGLVPAGFWLRAVAWIIDYVVLSIAGFILSLVFGGSMLGAFTALGSTSAENLDPAALIALFSGYAVLLIVSGVFGWLYYAILESSERQGTLGKMALNLVVTDMEQKRIGFGRATARVFVKGLVPILLGGVFGLITGLLIAGSVSSTDPSASAGIVALLSFVFVILLFIPLFMAGWTKRKQTLYDIMTGTLVLRK
jgi:uncharacterized RDD family membrane protein YckC